MTSLAAPPTQPSAPLSISGNYAIVGACMEDLAPGDAAGSAYIYERDGGGNWNFKQKIVANDRTAGDEFGFSVSISGDYAIVGAFQEDEDENELNYISRSGSAYTRLLHYTHP